MKPPLKSKLLERGLSVWISCPSSGVEDDTWTVVITGGTVATGEGGVFPSLVGFITSALMVSWCKLSFSVITSFPWGRVLSDVNRTFFSSSEIDNIGYDFTRGSSDLGHEEVLGRVLTVTL